MNCSGGVVERDARPPMFSKGNVRYLPSATGGLTSDNSRYDKHSIRTADRQQNAVSGRGRIWDGGTGNAPCWWCKPD